MNSSDAMEQEPVPERVEVFEFEQYGTNGKLSFGQALAALEQGRRVQRAGWNGKGMWLALTAGLELQSGSPTLRGAALHRAAELVSEHGDLDKRTFQTGDHIDMRAADGTLVIGWLASQTDMLAHDWRILP